MKIDGQCHCGAISFEAELDPEKVGICHCADCQALSASVFRTFAMLDGKTFKITKGSPKEYVKLADTGNRRVQTFCGDCGSALYSAEDSTHPGVYNIRLGIVRQRARIIPRFECWRWSALPWLPELEKTRKFDGNPQINS